MKQGICFIALLLLIGLECVRAEEWYQQGHQDLLTWQNFDLTVRKEGTYKFVKFFTRNCRYCRLLKQVEEQLREEKQWNFQFYNVDCSIHYDLCQAKATITGFPYVAIYNTKGDLAGKIAGYYPLETLREAFKTIQSWQNGELAKKPTQNAKEVSTQVKVTVTSEKQADQVQKSENQKKILDVKEQKQPEVQTKTAQTNEKPQKAVVDEDGQGWTSSIKDGLKMSVMLLGVIIFNKTISPYLRQQPESKDFSKPHIIEIPISAEPSSESAKEGDCQANRLLNDTL